MISLTDSHKSWQIEVANLAKVDDGSEWRKWKQAFVVGIYYKKVIILHECTILYMADGRFNVRRVYYKVCFKRLLLSVKAENTTKLIRHTKSCAKLLSTKKFYLVENL